MRTGLAGHVIGEASSGSLPGRGDVAPRWWIVFAVGAVAAYVAGLVVAAGRPEYPAWIHYGWIRLGCCLIGAIAIVVAAVVRRPASRTPWFCLALMCLGYAAPTDRRPVPGRRHQLDRSG